MAKSYFYGFLNKEFITQTTIFNNDGFLLIEIIESRTEMVNCRLNLNIPVTANSMLSNNNFTVRKLSEVSVKNIFHIPKDITAFFEAFIVAVLAAPVKGFFVA